MTAAPQPGPWVEAWLSGPRFGIYLRAAGGDRRLALALYEWNAAVSAAFHRDLAHFEVALRNAYDTAIVANTAAGLAHWTTDPYRLFPAHWRTARDGTRIDANRTPREQVERAVRAAGLGAPPGKVIAELMFGFWRYLSVSAHHHPLWIPYLHSAFAPGTSRRDVDRRVKQLHLLRNRIAHHELVLRHNTAAGVDGLTAGHLRDRHDDLLTVTALISPELRSYLAATSTVRPLLDRRPARSVD